MRVLQKQQTDWQKPLVYNKEMAEAKNRVIKRNGNNLKAIHVERLLTEVAPASLLFEILYPLDLNLYK